MSTDIESSADNKYWDSAFRIKRVRLRHFRSIASCDVKLGDLNLLVGANGSGKSSFLDALRLTADALQTTLDHALRDRGGIAEVRRRATGHPTHFGIVVDVSSGRMFGQYGFQVAAVRGKDFKISHEDCKIFRIAGPDDTSVVNEYSFRVRDGELVSHSEGVMPASAGNDRLYLVNASGIPAFRQMYDGLSGINVYNLNPDSMRSLQTPDSGEILRRDGSNIGSVLEKLRRDDPDTKIRIEEYLKRVVPGIEWVNRKGLGTYETIEVGQSVAGSASPWGFQATSISDGTLRALGVLTALFSGQKNQLSPIGVEEPESALHPAATGLLLEALRDASTRRQVLATSHSPDLLDTQAIRQSEIIAVTAAEGQTIMGPVDATGRYALEESLYTAGELLRIDQLRPNGQNPPQMDLFK